MRYTVGKKYPFILIQHELYLTVDDRQVHLRYVDCPGRPYLPWEEGATLLGIALRMLTCAEHHKVPNEWDEKNELTCDGFVFKDESDNTVWYNQYPRASYGQISDTNDRRVRLHEPDESKFKEMFDNETIHCMEDARYRLGEIHNGIWIYSATDEQAAAARGWHRRYNNPTIAASLTEHAKQVQLAIETLADRKLKITTHTFRTKDKLTGELSEHTLEGHFDVEFEEQA